MIENRLRCEILKDRIMEAKEAAKFFKKDMVVGASGFTPAGYPKSVPLALAERGEKGEDLGLTIITGASVGDELDGALSRAGVLKRRYPYQTNKNSRNGINDGSIQYADMHLSHVPQWVKSGFFGNIDIALVEAVAIREDGGIIPSTSIGNSNVFVEKADKVIVEINTSQPLSLEGVHDIYSPENPPNRKPIPLTKTNERIGTDYIPCDPDKIVAIVISDIKDKTRPVAPIDDISKQMAKHLIKFLEKEVEKERLPENLLPLQSGVGSVANAVLGGLVDSNFENLTIYSEVIQDSALDLLDSGKVTFASGTSLTVSPERLDDFYENFDKYKDRVLLRPQEISNNPEVIRRLGIIAMNTAIEVDIYGNVNSTNIMGSKMMNGIGGSGDFTRNAYLSIFTTQSIAKNGDVSSIVPMVSHHDHTEHDVHVIVTEQGVADLRGLSPKERAIEIIDNCAHPEYKEQLLEYLNGSYEICASKHTPHSIDKSLSWHKKFLDSGTMKK
ncbi:acetyl-CoA hydrolase/transferase family protein [Anaeromonas frigoriresistens]|nr:acetyl-CoA hydrolase/transferase family protein [Anaeromonas frigoriresistens]